MHNNIAIITLRHNTFRRALLFLMVVVASTGCSPPPEKRSEAEFLLGTVIDVTTYGEVPDSVFESVFERVREIETRMSTSEEDYETTELMEVNDAAGRSPVHVSEDTFEVVSQAVEYSRLTEGAFDVTVQPLVSLWGIGTESAAIPEEEQIDAALAAVDYRRVDLEPATHSIYLPREGMGVDVGGIAKGYAADEAERILRDAGVRWALLDFGGNILTIGTKPDGSHWRIGIQLPSPEASRGTYLGIVEVSDLAVVTSGTYERYFEEDGIRYHHILDTDTGYPVRNSLESVTIITDVSMRADALSTAVFAMGLDAGRDFVETLDEVEALFVTKDKEVYFTSGMRDYFSLTSEEYTEAQ